MADAHRWAEAVEENRETLEKIAESDLPLADDARRLLDEAEEVADAG